MGMLLYVWAIPAVAVALVAWAAGTRRLSNGPRRASMVASILLACGAWTLVRTDGVTSNVIGSDFHWRWTPTAEQRLLAQAAAEPLPLPPAMEAPEEQPAAQAGDKPSAPPPAAVAAAETTKTRSAANAPDAPATAPVIPPPPTPAAAANTRAEWPGFRGPDRDGIVRGVRIETDWSSSPPVEMWRRPIGPGWSSFAVDGDLLYTQEQRGDDEVVACYRVSTGEPVWRHRDAVRFWESNGGAGPRATPTLSQRSRLRVRRDRHPERARCAAAAPSIWSRNVATDTDAEGPGLGLRELAAGGRRRRHRRRLRHAWRLTTSRPATRAGSVPSAGGSYSSPHWATIDGVPQVLLLSGSGAVSVAPADGALLWEHEWPIDGATIVQPALTSDGDVLVNSIGMTGGIGMRRLAVTHGPGGWTVEERWTSTGLKPYFNDFVVHKGHAFGFDGSILSCIDLADGARKWKGGRYGNGQLVLLADQDLLLVLSEEGELALVRATPDQFTEVARFRRSRARPGTTPCWSATCCWCATARRWRRSGSRSKAADQPPLTLREL